MEKVRIGIVGCGGIARAHLDGYRLLRQRGCDCFEITAVCDVVEGRTTEFARDIGGFQGREPRRFKTVAANVPVTVGGVTVNPGDLIVGDRDGIVVVPAALVGKVLQSALEIEEREREQTRLIRETKSILQGLAKYQRI